MTAKAVSFRRGTTAQNNEFRGVEGEITVDLGENNDSKLATLRVHTGTSPKGGIALARADFANCGDSIVNLTKGSNGLARNDLNNITFNSASTEAIKSVLASHGFALSDGSNLETAELTPPTDYIKGERSKPAFARRDMGNVDTKYLAEDRGHTGGNLAYADMSNVNTSSLAESGANGTTLAYTTLSNVTADTIKNKIEYDSLALRNLDNVDASTIENKISLTTKYEQTGRKVESILDDGANNETYPSTLAVANYVKAQVNSKAGANQDLSNITDWSIASFSLGDFTNKYIATIESNASGHIVDEVIDTGIVVDNTTGEKLQIIINLLNEDGSINAFSLSPTNGVNSINQKCTTPKGTVFNITSQEAMAGNLAKADLSNITAFDGGNSVIAEYGYRIEDGDLKGIIQGLYTLDGNGDTKEIGMTSSETDTEGNITTKIGVENPTSNVGSGVIITKDGTYVNHGEATTVDNEHLIASEGSITSKLSSHNTNSSAHASLFNAKLDKTTAENTYATKTELNTKQNILTAGTNITISGSTISAKDTTYTAGDGIDITDGVISNTRVSAEWGNVTGDITEQEDLQNALSAKVSLENNETIAGVKTFSNSPIIPTPDVDDNSTKAATTAWVNTAIEAALGTVSEELASIIGE